MVEKPGVFGTAARLIGIVTHPAESREPGDLPGVVLLNSGNVPRVGSNRLYVTMARHLAEIGFPVHRFDFSGIGDSDARQDAPPLAIAAVSETQQAMDAFNVVEGVNRFILAGICSGALVSLMTVACDPRVNGAILINLAGHRIANSADYGRTLIRHYRRIAFSRSFGWKACRNAVLGRLDFGTLIHVGRSLAANLSVRRPARRGGEHPLVTLLTRLMDRGVSVALIHSEGDEGLDYVHPVLGEPSAGMTGGNGLEFLVIMGANHTFTLLANQCALLEAIKAWALARRERFLDGLDLGIDDHATAQTSM